MRHFRGQSIVRLALSILVDPTRGSRPRCATIRPTPRQRPEAWINPRPPARETDRHSLDPWAPQSARRWRFSAAAWSAWRSPSSWPRWGSTARSSTPRPAMVRRGRRQGCSLARPRSHPARSALLADLGRGGRPVAGLRTAHRARGRPRRRLRRHRVDPRRPHRERCSSGGPVRRDGHLGRHRGRAARRRPDRAARAGAGRGPARRAGRFRATTAWTIGGSSRGSSHRSRRSASRSWRTDACE